MLYRRDVEGVPTDKKADFWPIWGRNSLRRPLRSGAEVVTSSCGSGHVQLCAARNVPRPTLRGGEGVASYYAWNMNSRERQIMRWQNYGRPCLPFRSSEPQK